MNRVVPDAVPLTTYLSALTQGRTDETRSSPQSRPFTPRPHQPVANSSIRGSMLHHPSPPHTTRSSSHHLTPPDLHAFAPQRTIVDPTPSSVGPPHLSHSSTSYAPSSSQLSISPTITRYQIMQEHMDTMHSDIASLGHKHLIGWYI